MTDEEALRGIIETAFAKLRTGVEGDIARSADRSHKVREVAIKTLDELRAKAVADPAWLDRIIAQVHKSGRA